ncbi:MAG: penicillin-binding protein 2 [Helicobacteraceae bacterium]|jgi:penicillin-binding protein 2|nr:penicillin-binding protein 2 [Helicobacteraceae bacterium]
MRLRLLIVLAIAISLTLIGRVFYLTILRGEHYGLLALKNTLKVEPLLPVRGAIFDRSGAPLAVNRLGFSVSLSPHLDRGEGKQLDLAIDYLLSIMSVEAETKASLRARYVKADNAYSHEPVELTPFVPYETMLPFFTKLSLNDMIHIAPANLRHYPNGNVASHVLGYVSKADRANENIDRISRTIGYHGRDGLELYYNKELQGDLGSRSYQVTALNRETEEISRVEPSQMQDMKLFLDIRLQRFIHDLYVREGRSGAVIVMDLQNGGIIAAGSFPEYDNEKFITGISSAEWQEMINDFRHPFVNKLVNSLYPPGSIIKPSVALAFLESGKITLDTEFNCAGSFALADRNYRCWRPWGHGDIRMRRAIAESCDIYFYKGSLIAGIDAIAQKLSRHGFGAKTGADMPNEYIGVVPSRERKLEKYKRTWLHGDTVNTAIGQGEFLITPMQALENIALIATGKLIKPRFVESIRNVKTQYSAAEALSDSDLAYIDEIRGGMFDGANTSRGTSARAMGNLPFKIAGKTGTAQVAGIPQDERKRMSETELEFNMRSHAWYIGYAPYENPRYAFVALVEHGMSGGGVAAPISARILRKMNDLGYF